MSCTRSWGKDKVEFKSYNKYCKWKRGRLWSKVTRTCLNLPIKGSQLKAKAASNIPHVVRFWEKVGWWTVGRVQAMIKDYLTWNSRKLVHNFISSQARFRIYLSFSRSNNFPMKKLKLKDNSRSNYSKRQHHT